MAKLAVSLHTVVVIKALSARPLYRSKDLRIFLTKARKDRGAVYWASPVRVFSEDQILTVGLESTHCAMSTIFT